MNEVKRKVTGLSPSIGATQIVKAKMTVGNLIDIGDEQWWNVCCIIK